MRGATVMSKPLGTERSAWRSEGVVQTVMKGTPYAERLAKWKLVAAQIGLI